VHDDLGVAIPTHGSLVAWAEHGVLLLNTVLTVQLESPRSHARARWRLLTNAVIRAVAAKPDPVVFLLWGSHAQARAGLVTGRRHLVVRSPHPSPLARGFLESHPFKKATDAMSDLRIKPIDWSLE
jgi:uracil-DNA glycosylase